FEFGSGGTSGPGGNGDGGGSAGDGPTIFYSRRIGLNGARVIPVVGGGRLTGKTGPWSVGALNITTGSDVVSGTPQTNFSVVRMKHDIFRKSAIGGMFANRSVSVATPGSNQLWGVDANLAFFQNVYLGGYVAQTRTEGRSDNDLSYRSQFNYTGDRYGMSVD